MKELTFAVVGRREVWQFPQQASFFSVPAQMKGEKKVSETWSGSTLWFLLQLLPSNINHSLIIVTVTAVKLYYTYMDIN